MTTTLAGARAELIAAVEAASIAATDTPGDRQPPYVAVLGNGIDLERVLAGKALASFRLACVAGKADASASVLSLDTLKLDIVSMLRGLAGWQLGEVRPDGVRIFAGGTYLSADVIAARLIDL